MDMNCSVGLAPLVYQILYLCLCTSRKNRGSLRSILDCQIPASNAPTVEKI